MWGDRPLLLLSNRQSADKMHIWVLEGVQVKTGRTASACLLASALAMENPGKLERHSVLSHAFRSVEEVGMRKAPGTQRAQQRCFHPLLSYDPRPDHLECMSDTKVKHTFLERLRKELPLCDPALPLGLHGL